MRNPSRIHATPAVLRAVGLLFFLAGLGVMILLLAGIAKGNWPGLSQFCLGMVVGVVFSFVGWAVYADQFLVIDTWSREVIFYDRFIRAKEIGRTQLSKMSELFIEEDPDHPPCYRLMIDGQLMRERLSRRQAHRLKNKIAEALGLE